MLDEILIATPAFLLLAVRALAMIETAPLLSSDVTPQVVKLALAGFLAYSAFPTAMNNAVEVSTFGLNFIMLAIGEGMIGIITGFFINLVFAAFLTAGQFFSLQMGFAASETFDPLAQEENPLMGQYLNLVAMLVFLSIGGFRELFLGGFWRSVQSISIADMAQGREQSIAMLLAGLSRLFMDAMIIALPILGTLFLTSLATGLVSKAAPQINILSEGFPISITTAFILIFITLPFMTETFSRIIDSGFATLESLFVQIGHRIGG
ncbi:MAG: flagellar biosynthetic protein FliR [Treponema sp.]|jgi:flagellar biosynthetic protein FliR|nr:flagellar biosynthetic protein FliR [Treponema sp.]